jgi:phosphoglycerate dehydrogenase-like enzyme
MRMKYRTLVVCPPDKEKYVFPSVILEEIRQLTDCPWPVLDPANWRNAKPALKEADIIFSTWGMPSMSEEFLAAAPVLKAVFYAAGTVKGFVTDEGWDRGIIVSSGWTANSVPVAEYTLATILLSLKRFWHFSRASRSDDGQPEVQTVPGAYHTKVGLISMGSVGRATARLLKPFDFTLLAYDPFFSPKLASELNIGLVPLDELFRECDVISIHAPWIPETERMITGNLIASMKEGATLINTSRGAVVAEDELIDVLARRPDLSAVLDVTHPEPPARDSLLKSLPNVVLTPHIAGSMQRECERMGKWMVDELRRFLAGEPLRYMVTREQLARMA